MFNTTNSDNSKSLFADIPTTAGRSLFSHSSDQPSKSLFPPSQTTSLFNPPNLFSSIAPENKSQDLFSSSTKLPASGFSQANRSTQNPVSGHFIDRDTAPDPGSSPTRPATDRASASHWPAVKLSRLPAGLNQKQFLQRHFDRFGSIQRIICQPSLDAAYIAYDSVTSAQRAKRNGHTPLSDSDQILPSTVLLTLAQCRTRPGSDQSSGAPTTSPIARTQVTVKRKFSPIKSSVTVLSSPTKTTSIRQTSGPLPHKDLFHRVSQSSTDFTSQPKLPRSENSVEGQDAAGIQRPLPKFACTVDERVQLLQARQQAERRRRPTVVSAGAHMNDSFHIESGGGFEDHALATVPTPIRGSCPDMCPELERYFRELHQRVSIFECLPSTLSAGSSGWQMDHTRAVKDYERSSADQPTPLPCELRPTPVLHRTMAYLLASVADRPELDQSRNFWKPWYEFMWTRTRAIRKDVAQQRLCCPQIVGVIERIARFHIFCAARLVDQPIDSFDPRINSENLTQCLQTLKEMYNDLYGTQTADGEKACPCEPEFRAYMLLMKLNDQSAFNEVQMLPAHLLRSEEIRFAVAVHEAVTTNNYIRFFRLARLATCLNACLMHRYFVQIRSRALLRLAAAFAGHPKREVQYPLETLTRQLGFEDRMETQSFCEGWGLSVVDGFLIFDKQTPPQPPELAWRERRAFRLIEAKRAGIALSTLFNNGPTAPEDAQPVPVHSSFDINGRFIGQTESEQEADETKTDLEYQLDYTNQNQSRPKPPSTSFAPTSSTTQTLLSSSAPGFAGSDQKRLDEHQTPVLQQILSNRNALLQFVVQWIDEVLEVEPIARQALLTESVTRAIHAEFMNQALQSLVKEVVQSVVSAEQTSLVRELSAELSECLLEETVEQEVSRLARGSLAFESVLNDILWSDLLPCLTHSVAKSSLLLAEADRYYQRSLARCCFAHIRAWLHHKAQEEHDRALLRSMPACPIVHLDALGLIGSRAVGKLSALRRTRSAREAGQFVQQDGPISRFSSWASNVDRRMTWSPLIPSTPFTNRRIALFLPDQPEQCDNQFFQVVTPWLRAKLTRFNLAIVVEEQVAALPKDVFCAVLCVGYPGLQFRNSLHEHNNLPLLVLLPPERTDTAKDQPQTVNPCKCLTLPCMGNGQFVPHPSWTSVLQTGLDWLASSIAPSPQLVSHPALARSQVTPTPPVQPLQLTDLIRRVLAIRFFRPMAILSHDWSARGLVDPSIQSLVDAYHLVLIALLDHIREDSLRSQLHNQLHIQSVLLDQFSPDSMKSTTKHPWLQFISQWHMCADRLALDPDHRYSVNVAIERAQLAVQTRARHLMGPNAGSEILPDPVLAPWLRVGMVVARDRLEKFIDQHEDNNRPGVVVGLQTLEALVTYLSRSELPHKDGASGGGGLDEDEAFSFLVTHFSRLGQPATRIMKAIDMSVEAFRQQQIAARLDSKPPRSSSPTLISNNLQTRLDLLSNRLDEVECSMVRTIEETEAYSMTFSHFRSLSRRHSSRQ